MHTERHFNSQVVSADVAGPTFDLYRFVSFSFEVGVSGKSSPGSAYVLYQVSNSGSNWLDMEDTRFLIEDDSNEDVYFLEDADMGYRYVRLKFEITSGSFTADVWFNGQERGY